MNALVIDGRILCNKLLGDFARDVLDGIYCGASELPGRTHTHTSLTGDGVLPGELGSKIIAWASGRTTSVDKRESAASARAGLNNLISTCEYAAKTMPTSGGSRKCATKWGG